MAIPSFEEIMLPILQEIQKGSYKRTEMFMVLKNVVWKQWKLKEGKTLGKALTFGE